MRNLKKILALVLALVMSMSLFAVAGATDFSDDADIDYQEAVEVMTALEIIDGVGNNTFNPDGNVTRAQMAKMITIICLGNVDPSAFLGTTTDLTDINGHWAEAYIKYCYSQGIIAGKGNGVFSPNTNVTTVEAAKMLLVAIGYNSDVQGYEGSNWKINTIRDAQTSKFFDELSLTSDQALTRQQAAQMIYNAIQANTITKSSSVDRVTGTITDIYEANGKTLLEETFGCVRTTGTFNGDHHVISSLKEGQINVGGSIITYTMDNGNEWIGETVEVLWKDNATKGTKDKLDKEDTVYGVYNNGETEVLNVISDDIASATSYTTAGKIKVAGTEYELAKPAKGDVLVNTNYGASTVTAGAGTLAAAKTAFSDLSNQNGNTVKFVFNDNGKIFRAYVVEYSLGTVTAVNSEKVTISTLGSVVIEDNDIYSDIARNDVVVYTKLYDTKTADAYVTVTPAETVSGTVTGYKGTESVTLDGTVYDIYNKSATLPTSVGGESGTAKFGTVDINEEYTLYLVNGFVAAAVQTSESASNYSLVIDANTGTAGDNWDPLKVVALAGDGTKTTLTVDEDGDTDITIGDIITWTGSADEAMVDVEADWSSGRGRNDGSVKNYDDTAKTFNGTVTDTNCVLFVDQTTTSADALKRSDTFKVYNIRNLRDIAADSDIRYSTVVDDGKVVAAFIALGKAPAGSTSAAVIGIVSADKGVVKVDDTYYNQYEVQVSTEESYTVNIKASGSDDTLAKGSLYGFAPTGDDLYDNNTGFVNLSAGKKYTDQKVTIDGTAYDASTVYVKEYDEADQLLTYYTAKGSKDSDGAFTNPTGVTTKAVADDVVITYVDVVNDVAGDEIGINPFDAVSGYANVTSWWMATA